jgi:hypothetical protein
MSKTEEIEPEFALSPDDDVQNLITHGYVSVSRASHDAQVAAMRKNVERIEDDRRIRTGVLEEVEAWLSVLPDRHKLAIDRRAGVKGLPECGYDKGKALREVLTIP